MKVFLTCSSSQNFFMKGGPKNSTNSGFFVLYISAYQSTQSEVGGLFLFSET